MCVSRHISRLEIKHSDRNEWNKGVICPKCGLILGISRINSGKIRYCPLCHYQGTFLYRNLWLEINQN